MSNINFKRPHFKRGFSPHGQIERFRNIVYKETNMLKEPFIHYTNQDTYPFDALGAIWITEDPFEAFKRTLRPEERQHDKGRLLLTYPNWKREITPINLNNFILLDDVYDNGFYLAIDKRAARRSNQQQELNRQLQENLTKLDNNYIQIVNKLLSLNLSGKFNDSQTIDRLYIARKRYWNKSKEYIEEFNRRKK